MAVSPDQTLDHMRRLERERRRLGEARAATLRARLPAAVRLLRERYGVSDVILFGSLATGDVWAGSDVDLAVRDLASERYFEALADAMGAIGGALDLVRLEEASGSLGDRIEAEGERL